MRKLALLFAGLVVLLGLIFYVLRDRRPLDSRLTAVEVEREVRSEPVVGSAPARTNGQPADAPGGPTSTGIAAASTNDAAAVRQEPNAIPGGTQTISAEVLRQIQALQQEKLKRTPAQQKLDSQLIDAEKMRRGEPLAEGVATLRVDLDTDAEGRVLTDIDATVSADLLQRIAAVGGEVINHSAEFNAIRARLPLSEIEPLAARDDVKYIRPAVKAVTNVGSVTSEGDAVHRADTARTQFGVNGTGVKVGVLSDSTDHLAAAQASGDLGTVTILPGQSGVPASGEGTAMLEIVHDLAPGADLFYATGFGGPAAFAKNIRDLRFQSGCDIIIDDVTYFNESPFQDGVIAQAVNAVTADGALFFSSAANSGNKNHNTSGTWEGDFVDGGELSVNGQPQGRLHDFGGATHNTATKGGRVDLFWTDPAGAAANDYDVYVTDADGNNLVGSGTSTQNGTQDPYEAVPKLNDNERILIVKFSGAARFLHLETGRGRLAISTSGSTRGHNAARDGFTVAAVDANTSFPDPFTGNIKNPVERFSSDGFRRVFFHPDGTPITPGDFSSTGGTVWQKPDIAAADGVKTTLPADSGLNPFFGTSAAAPHAGAVAALLKSFNPALTAGQIRSIFTGTALDIEAGGVDQDSGVGIVMALQALQAAPGPEQPAITSFSPSSGGVGANVVITGTKLHGATQVGFNGVAATFSVNSATQVSATVPAAATTGRITITTAAGTATSATDFTVQATPAITGVTPASGAAGATVILTSANLNGATAVRFNNVNAPDFTVNSAVQITVTVPAGATSGRITVTAPAGTATSPGVFTVAVQPSIVAFTPATGGVGTDVVIDGVNFTGATVVRFNEVAATAFTVNSATRLTATVPAGASTGPISVTTPNGIATSPVAFTILPAPSITGFTPVSAAIGSSVTISGANFTGATAVRFNGVAASFLIRSAAQIVATVPVGASSGTVTVTTPAGTAASAAAFTVLAPPANDNLSNSQAIAGASGTVAGNNVAATKEVNEPDHAANPGGKSVWYRWVAPGAGAWQFTTTGSTFDTLLAVYAGTEVAALTWIASGDDATGGTNSILSFVAAAAATYHIAVDGFRSQGGPAAGASSGNVVLNWTATAAPVITSFSPPGGAPGTSVTIHGANFTGATAVRFNGSTAAFTVNSAAQMAATVPANATTGPIEVVTPSGSAISAASFAAVNPPGNDAFSGAQIISGNAGSVAGRSTDASKEPNEPDHAGNAGGRSIWYSWTAPGNGRWTFDTVGSSVNTLLAVYTGDALPALNLIGENDDAGPGTISRVAFNAAAGTPYRIAVDGRNGEGGDTVLNWAFTPNPPSIASFAPLSGRAGSTVVLTGQNFTGTTAVRLNGVLAVNFTVDSATQITFVVPEGANSGAISATTPNGTATSAQIFTVSSRPANDDFVDPQLLSGTAAVVAGGNVAATKETGEPDHANDPGGRSVWYRWTAPDAGTWALDTADSGFDTTLAVYTGTALDALTLVASNDDARVDRSSRLTFDATAGITYRIALDGFGGDNGAFVLRLLPAVAPEIIYETGFEATEGFNTALPLAGQNNWLQTGTGGNGVVSDLFTGLGQQAFVGARAPAFGQETVFAWRALNFTPQTNSRPVIRFSVQMGIVDSTTFIYDNFDWSVFNIAGERLFTLNFDNSNLSIYYRLDDAGGFHPTGATFDNGWVYDLVLSMDFGRNRWNATLNGDLMVSELPMTTTGATLDLGDIDAVWVISEPFFPGDNAMAFDEYRVTAEPSDTPVIVLGPQSQSVIAGSTVAFTVAAGGGEPLRYQWHFNGTPLPGQTGALLTLDNVSPGQAGSYSVSVSNLLGSVSASGTLTVNPPGPLQLLAGSRLPDGRFQFSLTGDADSRAAIEFSPDLLNWQHLTTVVITGGSVTVSDPDAGTQSRRFYRARVQP